MTVAKEALRQQMLLRALWRDARPGVLACWTRDGDRFTRGLQAYQAHAGALAERALAAAYPTVQQLLGEESFAALARALWHRRPPVRGDIDTWGGGLVAFLADAQDLAEEPYLADVARLEWAVHRASTAADDTSAPTGLERLADTDPAALWLLPRAGTAVLPSPHPVVTIWQCHRLPADTHPDRFVPVRQAFAEGRAEAALVWRSGWQVQVVAIDAAEAQLCQAVLQGLSLAEALDTVAPDFDFEAWLLAQWPRAWLAAAQDQPPPKVRCAQADGG